MIKRISIVIFWLIAWQIVSWIINNPLLFCGPIEAIESLCLNITLPSFWYTVWLSIYRIGIGFILAIFAGIIFGSISARFKILADLLSPLISVIKSTPVVCIIALFLVWFGSSITTSVITAMVVFPAFYFAIEESKYARNSNLENLFKAFNISFKRRILCARIPQVLPYLRAATKTAIGMAWKAGVAAELIGLPLFSIGERIYLSKLSLDTAAIISWTAVVICLGWISEHIVLWLINAFEKLPSWWLEKRIVIASKPTKNKEKAHYISSGININVEGLSKSFGNVVFEKFSIVLPAGSKTCLIAPSGTGKTTFLNIVGGFIEPTSGNIKFEQPKTDTEIQPSFSIMLQETCLIKNLTAAQNLAITAIELDELTHALHLANHLLDTVEASDKPNLNILTQELSGGMKRRVELARALAHPSNIVLLDEPFSGLDPYAKEVCAKAIINELKNRTLIIATHDENDAKLLNAEIIHLP